MEARGVRRDVLGSFWFGRIGLGRRRLTGSVGGGLLGLLGDVVGFSTRSSCRPAAAAGQRCAGVCAKAAVEGRRETSASPPCASRRPFDQFTPN